MVECGSGTYVRTLAADLGAALGGCAHLAELRRLRVGSFTLDEARPLDAVDRGSRRRRAPADRDGARPRRASTSTTSWRVPRRTGPCSQPVRSATWRRRRLPMAARGARHRRAAWRCYERRGAACKPAVVLALMEIVCDLERSRGCAASRTRSSRSACTTACTSGTRRCCASSASSPTPATLDAVCVTFDRHPAEVVRPESAPKLLTTTEQKLELLDATGYLDRCLVLHFDEERSTEPAEDFVREVLVDAAHAARRRRRAPTSTSARAAAATSRCSSSSAPSSASR